MCIVYDSTKLKYYTYSCAVNKILFENYTGGEKWLSPIGCINVKCKHSSFKYFCQ